MFLFSCEKQLVTITRSDELFVARKLVHNKKYC